MALAFYKKDIKERALAIAKLIREIPDETERRQTAREVCLQAVKDDPTFPEVRFLRDCGIKLNLAVGPALKVKKSKHFVRTCAADEQFTSLRRDPAQRRKQRQLNGEHDYPAFLDVITVVGLPSWNRSRKSAITSRYQCW